MRKRSMLPAPTFLLLSLGLVVGSVFGQDDLEERLLAKVAEGLWVESFGGIVHGGGTDHDLVSSPQR